MIITAISLALSTTEPDEARFRRGVELTTAAAAATRDHPSAAPLLSVVMVRRGEAPAIYLDEKPSEGPPATSDTPIYIASMTKAYVGLMAETLDARGVFDLDRPLTAVWPALSLPERDPSKITFRQLLNHQGGFENDLLSTRTAYIDEVPARDYPAILAASSEAKDDAFAYSNLGYLVYGAALEAQTGRHWRDWLAATVLQPLGLTQTRTSMTGAATPHHWVGRGAWDTDVAKTDDLMHAAGGLVSSPHDMGAWLKAQLETPVVLPARAWRATHHSQAASQIESAGLACNGYSMGWRVCDRKDELILLHGGGYSGARTWMAVAPDAGVAVAVLTNSDSLTGELGERLMGVFLTSQLDPDAPPADPAAFGADYRALLDQQADARDARAERERADPRWGGWTWTPKAEDRAAYVGRYRSEVGDLIIRQDGAGDLISALGLIRRRLRPASPDLFAGQSDAWGSLEALKFTREDGRVTAVEWGGDVYGRVD